MKLVLLSKDKGSGGNGCPSVYLAESGELVVQGGEVDTATHAELANVLPGETAVRIAPEVLLEAVERLRAMGGTG
ncbi:hypothetical protein [Actinomadura harenae]|uniref:Uncharacterized protein n=1 Tax=Actinomadura harenae TaxID=2483351 RepID=A0A3M2M9A1_9ACTN|nr:hypothetical protein [Actinomadura harenae]RMI46126.1 hypothetical protein EBO15_07850 [Actinomadura harenae]